MRSGRLTSRQSPDFHRVISLRQILRISSFYTPTPKNSIAIRCALGPKLREYAEKAGVLVDNTNRELQALDSIPLQTWRSRADGFTEYLNKRWLDYTGMTLDQALGWQWLAAIHPDDLPALSDTWGKVLTSGKPGEAEARMRRFDGVYRWFLFRAEPFQDESGAVAGWYGTNTDIEDRKHAEQKLRDSELNLRQMTETIPEMLWSATPDGAIDYCNTRLLDYTGFSAEEVKGDNWTKLLHPDDISRAVQVWLSCVTTGAPYRVEVRTIHAADRTYRWCVTNALPLLDQEGRILKWHGTVVDMHDWKQAQEDLRNTQAELAHITRVMTMGELAASIAHEVNQPLASIVTNGETGLRWLARSAPDIEKVQELTKRMVADARRASEIIDRIRAIVTGRKAQLVRLSLGDIIEESMTFLKHEFQSRGISVSLDLATDLPQIVGDRTQLQQVIVNLAVNAMQAMAHAGRRNIHVRTTLLASETVCCAIDDSGPGVDSAAFPRLFDSFFTTKEAGMGMGLPISRSIIEAHGGRIRVENNSTLGGARFSFELPANGAG
ncbi:PAS domain-containing sensor histidine kinase [Bradyrhizobium niftali]|uniref:histidine kinase n=1 Tax=Bradyrhizobium niftali TaxID=2560055 RepID=A0A4Y9M3X0_9BRAD|nr:PAS domain-containing sensor histidine kinase [Bradyrhizobium niftali]